MDEEAIMGLAEGLVRAVFLEASTAFTPVPCTCRFTMSGHNLPACSSPEHPHVCWKYLHRLPRGIAARGAGYSPVLWSSCFCFTACWDLQWHLYHMHV